MNVRLLQFLVMALSLVLAACSPSGDPAADGADAAAKGAAAGRGKAVVALAAAGEQAAVPQVVNPAEELQEFDPRGILRWTAVAGADVYEVWAFADAQLSVPVETSGGIRSREYQFRSLAPGARYHLVLYARTGGQWVQSPAVAIRTAEQALKPRLLNPQEELEGLRETGLLRWSAIAGADRYELWIYRDAELLTVAESSGAIRETQYQVRNLLDGRSYHVVVFARVNGAWHGGGPLRVTVTGASTKARILNTQEELDGFVVDGLLRWSAVTNATAYEVWIFADPGLTTVVESSGSLETRSYGVRRLQADRSYFAQVYARVGGEWLVGSPIQLRTAAVRSKARLTNSQEDLERFGATGTLTWTPVPGAEFYEVWLYTDASLVSLAESARANGTSHELTKACADATYYAQIHSRVNGSWTAGWPVRIDVRPGPSSPSCVAPAPAIQLTADADELLDGGSAALNWTSKFATSCTASGGWSGSRGTSGRETIGPVTSSRPFALTCTGPSGQTRVETYVAVVGFTLADMDERYLELSLAHPGYLPGSGWVLEFDAGRGRILQFNDQFGQLIERPFAWSLENGALRLDLDTPIATSSQRGGIYATPEELQKLAESGIAQVPVDLRTVGYTYSRDVGPDLVARSTVTTRIEVSAPPIRLADGSFLTLQNLPTTESFTRATDLRPSRSIDWKAFAASCPATGSAVCVPGVWAGPYRFAPGIAATGQPLPVTAYSDRLEFDPGGTVTGKFSGRSANWSIAADGALVIRFDDGWTETLRILESVGLQHLVYAEFTNGQQSYRVVDHMFDGDATFRFSAGQFVSSARKYWNSEIGASDPDAWAADGSRQLHSLFGWKLDEPFGTGRNFAGEGYVDCDGDGPDDARAEVAPMASWKLTEDGGLIIDRDENRPGARLRHWYPVARGSNGQGRWMSVLEFERRADGRLNLPPRINVLQELDRAWDCVKGPGFTASGFTGRFYDVAPANFGYVSRSGSFAEFDGQSQTGRAYEFSEFTGTSYSEDFSWSVQDGRLVVGLTSPRVTPSFPLYQSLPYLTDEEKRILAAKYLGVQVEVHNSVVRQVYSRIFDANGFEATSRETTTEVSVPPIRLNDGTLLVPSGMPVTEVTTATTTLRSRNSITAGSFTAACPASFPAVCVPGVWGGFVVYSPGISNVSRAPYPEGPFAELLNFTAGGRVTGLLSGQTAVWFVDGTGALVIVQPNGWRTQVELVDAVGGGQYGAAYDFRKGDRRIGHYGSLVKRTGVFTLTADYIASPPGKFWLGDINGWNPANLDASGAFRLDQYFGWQFDRPGPVGRNIASVEAGDCDGDGPDDLKANVAPAGWSVSADGRLLIERGSVGNLRRRSWVPIGPILEGPPGRKLHTIEFEQRENGYFQIAPRLTTAREMDAVWGCTN